MSNETKKDKPIPKVYRGETAEDIVSAMSGKVPEKDLQAIMDTIKYNNLKNTVSTNVNLSNNTTDDIPAKHKAFITEIVHSAINKAKQRPEPATTMTIVDYNTGTLRTIDIPPVDKTQFDDILILTTDSHTTILPHILSMSKRNEIALEIFPSDDATGTFQTQTRAFTEVGEIPTLVIPHKCENNDNAASLTKILSYIKKALSNQIQVQDIECDDKKVTAKKITFK